MCCNLLSGASKRPGSPRVPPLPNEPAHIIGPEEIGNLLRAATPLVTHSLRESVTLTEPESVSRYGHVLRCVAVTPSGNTYPLILKTPQKKSRHARLMNDAAALDFLNRLPPTRTAVWPRLYGVSREYPFVVSEDLGINTMTAVLLAPPGPTAYSSAEAALLQQAETLAALAILTKDREAEFEAIRTAHGPREDHVNFRIGESLADSFGTLLELLSAWGVSVPPGWEAEYHLLCHTLSDARTPFRSLTTFDHYSENAIFADGTVKLIDFDCAQFRPVLLDGVTPRLAPTGTHIHILPPELAERSEEVYRRRLSDAFPEAADTAVFYRAVAESCAFWMFYYLRGYGMHIVVAPPEQDFSWAKRLIVKQLREFLRSAERMNALPLLTEVTTRLEKRLTVLWIREGVNEITPFPALRIA
jgi:hypothetical protein